MQLSNLRSRVLARIKVEDRGYSTPCWISTRARQRNGYTKIGVAGRTMLTHRVAFEAFVNAIPDGMQIDHLCRQRECCNPDHLEPVTCRENLVRGDGFIAKQTATTTCPRGHELTPANTYRHRGHRECLTCRRSWRARRAAHA